MKALSKPTITTIESKLQEVVEDAHFEYSERPWHAYPEVDESSYTPSQSEFINWIVDYVIFMKWAKWGLIVGVIGCILYAVFK